MFMSIRYDVIFLYFEELVSCIFYGMVKIICIWEIQLLNRLLNKDKLQLYEIMLLKEVEQNLKVRRCLLFEEMIS